MVRSLFVIALTALSALAHAISLPDARPEDISISKNILTGPQGKLHHAYHRALQTSDEPSSNAVASPSTSPSGPKSPTLIPTSSFSPTVQSSALPTGIPSYMPTSKPSLAPIIRPSFQPTKVKSTSPSITSSPTNVPSMTHPSETPTSPPTKVPSTQPSNHPTPIQPSSKPTIAPSSGPSSEPTSLPTTTPTSTPSALPSYGIITATTDFLEMTLEGLDGKFEGSEESDQWRENTSVFIQNYFNLVGGELDLDLINVITHIEKQEFILGVTAGNSGNATRSNLRTGSSRLRIIFTQDFAFRGSVDYDGPVDIFPLLFQNPAYVLDYISFLKGNDQTPNKIFGNIVNASVRIVQTEAPSLSPTIAEPLNIGGSTSYLSEILIALGSVSGVIGILFVLGRTPACKMDAVDGGEEEDSEEPYVTMQAANRTNREVTPLIEEEQTPSSSRVEHMLAENPLEESDSKASEMIDLSLYRPSGGVVGSSEDQDVSIQEESELEDSDSMISYDVYSTNDDESSGTVPKGLPKHNNTSPKSKSVCEAGSKTANTKTSSNQENLVVTGAPLSPSRQDGPKIGTTTVIEGTGALKGIQMMTVGVIDDMEVSSPAK